MTLDREQALDTALGQIERQFGKGSVMRMNDQAQVAIGAISTGSLALDLALGIGGLPRGRIIEVFGPESSGKTTLVYHVIAEAQRRGGICAFIDAEHAMDPAYAKRIGVNIDDLLVSQPDTGEQALEIAELLIRSGALDVVAVDSVAALTPKAEIEGEMGDSHVGLQARLMSQALRKLAGTLNRTDTICLFTNQLREKIGVMFGSPETTPGGRALKFYASIRLDIRRIETLKDGVEAFGNRVRVKVVKNKVAPPFKQAEFDIIYGTGISWEGSVLDTAIEKKVVQKSGSHFSFEDERLGQGRQNATAFLREHPDVSNQILERLQALAGPDQVISARLLAATAAEQADGRPALEAVPTPEAEAGGRGRDRVGRGAERGRLEGLDGAGARERPRCCDAGAGQARLLGARPARAVAACRGHVFRGGGSACGTAASRPRERRPVRALPRAVTRRARERRRRDPPRPRAAGAGSGRDRARAGLARAGTRAGRAGNCAARGRSRYGPAAGGTGLRRGRSRGGRCARGLSNARIRRLHLTFCLHLNVFPNRI